MKNLQFVQVILLTVGMFTIFLMISSSFDVYLVVPIFAFFAYSTLIGGILWAVCLAKHRWHFILSSVCLVLLGTMASLDILLSKEEMLIVLNQQFGEVVTEKHVDDAVQVLLVLVNIFTGSLAADVLFHGLSLNSKSRYKKAERLARP
ncbi:hypothetical protein L4C33_02870 [Vibrio makurazakiensis]|uniref:hypothetical protein n=1 Tax=Vibrio makurazakiensis TaxID=2910250 RepID=UPI003D0B15EC